MNRFSITLLSVPLNKGSPLNRWLLNGGLTAYVFRKNHEMVGLKLSVFFNSVETQN